MWQGPVVRVRTLMHVFEYTSGNETTYVPVRTFRRAIIFDGTTVGQDRMRLRIGPNRRVYRAHWVCGINVTVRTHQSV